VTQAGCVTVLRATYADSTGGAGGHHGHRGDAEQRGRGASGRDHRHHRFGLVNPYGALTEAAELAKNPGDSGPALVPPGTRPAGVAASTLFRSGSPLPPSRRVHRSVITLAGSAAAIVAGLICLAAPFWLRPRRGPAAAGRLEQLAQP
jgi:hypothetical protein